LIAQGHDLDTVELTLPNLRYREPMLLARNTGKSFVDMSAESGEIFRKPWVARGMATGDLDNDGRVDAVVMDTPIALYYATGPRVRNLELASARMSFGIGIRKSDDEFPGCFPGSRDDLLDLPCQSIVER